MQIMIKTYQGLITDLKENQIFVFGSNIEERHGAGTARLCLNKYGAKYGQASGLQGQSYGLITTDLTKPRPSRTPQQIIKEIERFYEFAKENPQLEFLVAYTAEGYNLCGYSSKALAKMFATFEIPENVIFNEAFAKLM